MAFSDKFQRSVIPRWHDSKDLGFSHEAQSLTTIKRTSIPDASAIRQELLETKTLGVAVDALNVAIAAGDEDTAILASEIICSRGDHLPDPIVGTARNILGQGQQELPIIQSFLHIHHQRIAELRSILRVYPRSPLAHLDLARHQLTLGQVDKAKKEVLTALTLSPHNRNTLRVASRFFVSIDERDRAYQIILDAESTRNDPWLVAAEIALSQVVGKDPRHWRIGKDLLVRAVYAPLHLSELASAIGTKEMLAGNTKGARKLFRQGLLAPTENALAQARWAEGQIGASLVENHVIPFDGSQSFEAGFFKYFIRGEMQEAIQCGKDWFYTEPFSSTAASATAHVAGLLDDYEAAEKFATMGLHSHLNRVNLRNNLLYAQISSGKLFEGDSNVVWNRIKLTVRELRSYVEAGGTDGVHALANLGLLAFRVGQIEDGKALYERTIEIAHKVGHPQQAATAAVFFARESILSGAPWANAALERARAISKPFIASPTTAPSITFYLKKIEALAQHPENAGYILSAQSAKDFLKPKSNVKLKVTRKPDGGIIVWVPPRV